MPRLKRAKVAPSAPTALPFLQNAKAKSAASDLSHALTGPFEAHNHLSNKRTRNNNAQATRRGALMSGALKDNVTNGKAESRPTIESEAKDATEKRNTFDDLYDVSDKENDPRLASVAESQISRLGNAAKQTPLTRSQQWHTSAGQRSRQHSQMRSHSGTTPLGDSSMLSLADFKRRPRQPSILRIGRPDDTPTLSSLGPMSDDLDEDLDDFRPVDESTPLRFKQSIYPNLPIGSKQQTSTSKSKPLASVAPPNESRKRKLAPPNPVTVNQSQSSNSPDQPQSSDAQSFDNFNLEIGSVQEEPVLPNPRLPPVRSPIDVWDEVMALPQSDSSLASSAVALKGVRPTSPSKRQTADGVPRPAQRGRPARGLRASKTVSTAALQALLPRRRHHPSGEHGTDSDLELPSELSGNEEDELSIIHVRKQAARKPLTKSKSKTKSSTSGKKNAVDSTHNIKSKSMATPNDGQLVPPSTSDPGTTSGLRTRGRTYGRRASAGEDVNDSLVAAEDDGDDSNKASDETIMEDNGLGLSTTGRQELRKVSKKFQEVDEWKMDFEDVSGGSSSPMVRLYN